MEEEIQSIQQVKRTKPRTYVPFFVEVITYTNPISWVSEERDELSSDEDEDEVTSKEKSLAMDEQMVLVELKDEEKVDDKLQ